MLFQQTYRTLLGTLPRTLFFLQEFKKIDLKCSFYPIEALHHFYGTSAKSADPDQMPRNVELHQVLQYLLTECSIEICGKIKNTTQHQ